MTRKPIKAERRISNTPSSRQCGRCDRMKPLSDFEKKPANKSGYGTVCEECRITRRRNCLVCGLPIDGSLRRKVHKECAAEHRRNADRSLVFCRKCKRSRLPRHFTADATRKTGYYPWCRECTNQYRTDTAFQPEDADLNGHICPLCDTPIKGHANRRYCSTYCKGRVSSLRKKYGMSVDQYKALLSDSGGKCPICLRRVRKWNIDHNHTTRKTTGAVCTRCNVGALAHTYHDVEYAKRLYEYLLNPPTDRLGIDTYVPEEYNEPSKLHKTRERGRKGRRK